MVTAIPAFFVCKMPILNGAPQNTPVYKMRQMLIDVYLSVTHRTQSLPCAKGGGLPYGGSEGLCSKVLRICIGFRRIANLLLRQPLSQNRLTGADFDSSPYTGEPLRCGRRWSTKLKFELPQRAIMNGRVLQHALHLSVIT